MLRLIAGSLLVLILAFFYSLVFAGEPGDFVSTAGGAKKHFVFSDKNKVQEFVKQQNSLGIKAKVTTQKQPGKRYSVLLKGYTQWTPAFTM